MRKHFLLLFLMALLPLAGWAEPNYYDVTVTPYDATSVWSGGAPTVQRGWISLTGTGAVSNPTVKDAIAHCLVAQTTDGYDVGEHTYKLVQSSPSNEVQVGDDWYTFHVLSSSTATLTITKCDDAPAFIFKDGTFNGDNLTYNGSAQALLENDGIESATINGARVPVIYTLDPTAETPVTFDNWQNVKATDAGAYKLYVKVVGTDNYVGSTAWKVYEDPNYIGEPTESKVINQYDLTAAWEVAGATPTANTWTYDTEAHVLFSAPEHPISFGTTEIPYEYSLTGEDETWYTSAQIAASEDLTAAFKGTSNTGNKTVNWRVKETANYTGHAATALTATITKATPTFTTEPTFAESRAYNGEELVQIVSAGETTLGAKPVFRRRTKGGNGSWGSWSDWKEDLSYFTRTNAGVCQIQYTTRTTNDLNPAIASPYGDPVTIEISKVTIAAESFTAPAAAANLVYSGGDQALITAGSWGENPVLGTFQYSLNGTDWSADIPQATNADNYDVYYKIVPTDATNCEEYVAADPIAAAIGKATIPAASFNAPVAATGLKADGIAHALVTAATWIDPYNYGTFEYSLTNDGTDWSEDVPEGTDAGTYNVYFRIKPTDDNNYNVYAAEAIAVTIGGYTPVYIVPTAAQKYYGTEDPASFEYTVVNATTSETLDNSVLNGTVSLARTNGNAIGTYKIYVKNYTPVAEDGDYTVVNILNTPASEDAANKTAVFTILVDPNAELKLNFTAAAITNKASKVYDGTKDITALGFTVDDLEADETTLIGEDTWESLKGSATVVFALAAENGNAQETQVTATVSGGLTARYATVTVTPMDFEITKLPITITANDQVIAQGADIAQDEYVTDIAPVAGDDLNIVLTATKTAVGEWDDAITVAATNANYDFTFVPGKLTINSAGALALGEGGDDLQLISDYAGQNVPVTIDFTARNARKLPASTPRTWTANTWVTLTLPFDISVADLSKALGYAIVNVVDPSKTEVKGNETVIAAKLTMKGGNGKDDVLAANKPFLVKTADAINGAIDFGTQTIVAPASADDLSVNAGGGAKFVGTYAPMTVDKDHNAETVWFMIGGGNASWAYIKSTSSATWDILPFEGYIDMNGSSARNMTFYFEELDGSTTAIKSVSTDNLNGKMNVEGWYNLNGVKLQGVPTEKGVYIQNGKKVVIK